jgi:ribosome recycling factor
MSYNLAEIKQRMQASIDSLEKDYVGLRTGRASTNMLESVTVEAYGSRMPLNQVGTVSVPEPRLLTVQVWDASMTKAVEKSIREAGLGLNPQGEGTLIRVPVPELSTERRAELQKVAGKYAEAARVAIRNIRRDGMDAIKKLEKEKIVSEDDSKRHSDETQKVTDEFIKKVDSMLSAKEADVMKI